MENDTLQQVMIQYSELLNAQQFDAASLDYSIAEYHRNLLNRLDVTGTSCIAVFDLCRQKHIYMSDGYHNILGLNEDEIRNNPENADIDDRMHPDDQFEMTVAGMHFLKIAFALPTNQKKLCKLVAEYRIRNKQNEYIRVIEQFQAIELDKKGNVWLALCLMDISPNQELNEPFRCKAMNFSTGEMMDWEEVKKAINPLQQEALSPRENEILSLIATGMMSKEIADKLYISVHTVNTHRQRILEKLGADNSREAILYGQKLGLI